MPWINPVTVSDSYISWAFNIIVSILDLPIVATNALQFETVINITTQDSCNATDMDFLWVIFIYLFIVRNTQHPSSLTSASPAAPQRKNETYVNEKKKKNNTAESTTWLNPLCKEMTKLYI